MFLIRETDLLGILGDADGNKLQDLTPCPPLPSHTLPPGEGGRNWGQAGKQKPRRLQQVPPLPVGRVCDGRGGQGVRAIHSAACASSCSTMGILVWAIS